MTERPPDPDVGPDADATSHALVALHAFAGGEPLDPELTPGLRPLSPREALSTIAEADEESVPVSARLAVLHDLARAGRPHGETYEREYRLVSASVAEPRGLDVDTLLADIDASARGEVPFEATATGRSLPHHLVAFIGQDVCTVRQVQVDGIGATWIFSEFETDAPFDQAAGWVDPRSWPERGPLLFKRMDLVGTNRPVGIDALGDQHWHGVFHEEVQLVTRVNTLLHCDYWRDGGRSAGMTYELDLSLDGEIDVDRGFLSVDDVGGVRRVKALKIVGFTTRPWNQVARLVCPLWTDWVRGAVEGGTTSSPRPPSHIPTGAGFPGNEALQAWVEFFGDSARRYFDLFQDSASRIAAGGYSTSDWITDGTRYWSRLAKDWAEAWKYGIGALDEVAREGLDAGLMPPGSPPEAARGAATAMTTGAGASERESLLIPVPALTEADAPVCSPLVSIEAGGVTLDPGSVSITVETLDDGTRAVRLRRVGTTAAPPGLYVGRLESPAGRAVAPVQLYISGAAPAGGR